MSNLNSSVENLKKEYREIFSKSVEEIQKRIDEIKPSDLKGDIFDEFPKNTEGQKWQQAALTLLDKDISKEVYRKFQEVLAYRNNFRCVGCATCCNLACSEFSPDELKEKAANGDKFAKQFMSIFIPYNT